MRGASVGPIRPGDQGAALGVELDDETLLERDGAGDLVAFGAAENTPLISSLLRYRYAGGSGVIWIASRTEMKFRALSVR